MRAFIALPPPGTAASEESFIIALGEAFERMGAETLPWTGEEPSRADMLIAVEPRDKVLEAAMRAGSRCLVVSERGAPPGLACAPPSLGARAIATIASRVAEAAGAWPAATVREGDLSKVNQRLLRQAAGLREAMSILERRNRQMIKELNLAVELQKALLPKAYPDMDSIVFTHRYIPLAMVGGDFFDIIKLDEDRVGILITDVSGHGVAPAFITAMIKSSFDYLGGREASPARLIERLNTEFSTIVDTDHFITAFYGILDFQKGECLYCSAGHPSMLIVRKDSTAVELGSTDCIIGMMDEHAFSERSVPIEPGDILAFYTDGVIESRSAQGELFGVEGVERVVLEKRGESLDAIADEVIIELIQFMKDPVFEDDITLLLAQVIDTL